MIQVKKCWQEFFKTKENKYEAIKAVCFSAAFFIIVGAYTVVREIKDSIFVLTVGQSYIPEIKNISSFVMIPLVIFYAWLSYKVRKEFLLIFYSLVYGIGGLVIAYYLKDPEIGLYNSVTNPSRMFGWLSYLFLDGYSSFVVSVLWAYFNSVSSPEDIKSKYVHMTLASKLGGVFTSGFVFLCMCKTIQFSFIHNEVDLYIYIMRWSSFLLLIVPLLFLYLMYKIPHSHLEGYAEKKEHKDVELKEKKKKQGILDGIKIFFKYPYVLGIYGMIFFWEITNVVFNYMRINVFLKESDGSIAEFGALMYKSVMFTHLAGFFIALFGTAALVKWLGQKKSLVLVPFLTGGAILICLYCDNASALIATYIFIRAINYSFAYPLREGLYIPTSHAIKFQAKSWIDSFGQKLSKAFGSAYNKIIQFVPFSMVLGVNFSFFFAIILLWTFLAHTLGKKWEKVIENKEVIG